VLENIKGTFVRNAPDGREPSLIFTLSTIGIGKIIARPALHFGSFSEEGIARAQIEALACGLPVIGTMREARTTWSETVWKDLLLRTQSQQIADAMT